MKLTTAPNLPDVDRFYADLLAAHRGLGEDACRALDADLVLILANHIGDPEALSEALALAREMQDPKPG